MLSNELFLSFRKKIFLMFNKDGVCRVLFDLLSESGKSINDLEKSTGLNKSVIWKYLSSMISMRMINIKRIENGKGGPDLKKYQLLNWVKVELNEKD